MAFGKRKSKDETQPEVVESTPVTFDGERGADDGAVEGPFDVEDFDDPETALVGRHDLGAVLIPENEAAELAVEVNPQGVPTMAWMVTSNGRYNVTAYAAPKAGSLWREVATEVAESLRKEAAEVSIEDGPWGREVVGLMTNGPEPVVMRFVGVDGYRWMVRGAAVNGSHGEHGRAGSKQAICETRWRTPSSAVATRRCRCATCRCRCSCPEHDGGPAGVPAAEQMPHMQQAAGATAGGTAAPGRTCAAHREA